jgi:hypothetical protein
VSKPVLHAFIDEAGQRSRTPKSSSHFIMSAVVVPGSQLGDMASLLAQARLDLHRRPGDTLHWRNVKSHPQKVHFARMIGSADYLTVCTVVMCKRHLTTTRMNDDQTYLYTFRYLLERLSWFARDQGAELKYTLAHVVRFKLQQLRDYEITLQRDRQCQITWSALDPRGGRLDQPSRVEGLQLADAAASATFAAYEVDVFGNTEDRYLRELSARLYRRGAGSNALTSYGLKIYPATAIKADHPWVAAL